MTSLMTAIKSHRDQLAKLIKPAIFVAGMWFAILISGWTVDYMCSSEWKWELELANMAVNYVLFLLIVPFGSYFLFAAKSSTTINTREKIDMSSKISVVVLVAAAIVSVVTIGIVLYLCAARQPLMAEVSPKVYEAIWQLFKVPPICILIAQLIQCINIPKLGRSALPLFFLNGGIIGVRDIMLRFGGDLDISIPGAGPYLYKGFLEMGIFVGVVLLQCCVVSIIVGKRSQKMAALA